ncbi:hypothetical protein EII20_13245 [Comamonadaceae bacterium OH2545_COT-014]|nr:hypothetical protein EII20_13245 [Comamonadaceae bacterium OH2545_COT-014]
MRMRRPPRANGDEHVLGQPALVDAPPATGQWALLQAVQPPPALPEPPAADAPEALAHDPDHPDEAHDPHGPDWRIQWLYIHYPAHTEVAPVIARPGPPQALHRIRLHNGGPDAIVRWQINGQEVLVSRRQASLPGDCDADTGGYLRAPAPATQPQTWQLRWQTLAAPGQWQQAEVQVPALAADSAPPAALTEQAVALHRQPDGRWLARRVHRHGRGAGQQVHATALPEPLACGPSDAEPAAP